MTSFWEEYILTALSSLIFWLGAFGWSPNTDVSPSTLMLVAIFLILVGIFSKLPLRVIKEDE